MSASRSAAATRSKTRSAPGVAAASSSVSTRADSGSYGIRWPPPNHSAAVTRARSCRGGSAVLYLPIGSLPHHLVDAVHINARSGRCPLCYPVAVTASRSAEAKDQAAAERRRRPRGAVRDGLVAAGLELARTGGPDAVVLREATRMVGVVPNAAYRHFADRDELLAAVCAAAMARARRPHGRRRRPRARQARRCRRGPPPAGRDRHGVPGVRPRGTGAVRHRVRPAAAARLRRSGRRDRAGPHAPGSAPRRARRAGRRRRAPAGSAATASSTPSGPRCTGWPCSPGKAPCATSPMPPGTASRSSPSPSSARAWPDQPLVQ